MDPADVQAIERATLAAMVPERLEMLDGWLVALSPGTVRRTSSAVPLSHRMTRDRDVLERIEALYAEAGMPPAFRLCDAAGLDLLRTELIRLGYRFEQPTLVMTGEASGLRALASGSGVELAPTPDEAWCAAFLGEGFDPVDGACRIEALRRGGETVFASVRDGEQAVAVGAASFSHGWASIHGMRTVRSRRGEGLAGDVLAALATAAQARGLSRVFLQVEEGNAPARALYRRAGFAPAWRYFYWTRPR